MTAHPIIVRSVRCFFVYCFVYVGVVYFVPFTSSNIALPASLWTFPELALIAAVQ